MSKLRYIIMIGILLMFLLTICVYGFENEIYKIDIPNTYTSDTYLGSSMFTKDKDTGIIILSVKSEGLKKDFSTMSKTEMNEIIDKLVGYKTDIIDRKKEKLGKSKSIKARLKSKDSGYVDMYIVVSDKHVLLVGFIAPYESDLDSQEFKSIKKSFKMKERTTNATLIRVGGFLLVAGGSFVGYNKKRIFKI